MSPAAFQASRRSSTVSALSASRGRASLRFPFSTVSVTSPEATTSPRPRSPSDTRTSIEPAAADASKRSVPSSAAFCVKSVTTMSPSVLRSDTSVPTRRESERSFVVATVTSSPAVRLPVRRSAVASVASRCRLPPASADTFISPAPPVRRMALVAVPIEPPAVSVTFEAPRTAALDEAFRMSSVASSDTVPFVAVRAPPRWREPPEAMAIVFSPPRNWVSIL